MKRAYKTASIALCLLVGGFVVLVACSNQGEGERCESLNGNDDCKTDEDLVCYPADQLRAGETADRCCPRDRTKATHPVCVMPSDVIGDATAPPDTGPPSFPPDATDEVDAGDDGSPGDAEAGSDAALDADARDQ